MKYLSPDVSAMKFIKFPSYSLFRYYAFLLSA